MEDFERMQHREHQRQELLTELKRLIWDKLNEEGIVDERINEDCFYWGLVTGAASYMSSLTVEREHESNVFYSSALSLFKTSIALRINSFTQVAAERKLLAAELLKYAVEELSRPVYQEILRLSVPPARDEYLKQIGLDKLED